MARGDLKGMAKVKGGEVCELSLSAVTLAPTSFIFIRGILPMSSHWLGRATLPEGYLTAVLGEPSRSPETWTVTSSVVGPFVGAKLNPRGCGRRWRAMSEVGVLLLPHPLLVAHSVTPFSPQGPPQCEPVLWIHRSQRHPFPHTVSS